MKAPDQLKNIGGEDIDLVIKETVKDINIRLYLMVSHSGGFNNS